MGTKTLLSLEEFVQLPDDDQRHELDEGELVVMPPAKFLHSLIAKRIYDSILAYLAGRQMPGGGGQIFSETAYLLEPSAKAKTVRQPDVSYVADNRPSTTVRGDYLEGAPDLAVEVVSPGDTAEQMARKVRQYLASGSAAVWVVYPATSEVHIFFPAGQARGAAAVKILSEGDTLTEAELFPGWSGIPLDALFA